MRSVKDMLAALSDDHPLSFRAAIAVGVYPLVHNDTLHRHSLGAWCRRFSAPGHALRQMAAEQGDVWTHLSRSVVVGQVRQRLRNPFVIRQEQTDLCGPASIVMEFARRNPTRYVRAAAELLRTGVFTAQSGKTFVAEADLRQNVKPESIDEVDWLFCATMRDSENTTDDIDDAQGIEGMTMPLEIEDWIEAVLDLKGDYYPCWAVGEMDALAQGHYAINAGGMAILLVDSNLIKHWVYDDEEKAWVRSRSYGEGGPGEWTDWSHVKDDNAIFPDHYVVLLSTNLDNAEPQLRVLLWSYGRQYQIKGTRDAFGEYLFTALTGRP